MGGPRVSAGAKPAPPVPQLITLVGVLALMQWATVAGMWLRTLG